MSKRTKRERRRPATDALPETPSHQFSDRQYTEFRHATIDSRKPKDIRQQLPPDRPRPLRREFARSIAKLERLAREGKDPPGIRVDYLGVDGRPSTFHYVPGDMAERMAQDIIEAAFLLQQREAQA